MLAFQNEISHVRSGPQKAVYHAMEGDAFLALSARRRSTRLFKERPVPLDLVKKVIQAGILAPSSCNRQLWHFVIVTDKEMKKKVSAWGDDGAQSYIYDAPIVIAVFYDTTMESRNPCYTPYLTSGMASYGILLAAEAEGLGAIFLGGIRSPAGVARALDAPEHMQNLGLICLGYRDDVPPSPHSRRVEEVISFDRFPPAQPRCLPDIRPHLWSLPQLSDFRDKILWYKGIGVDGKTLHVNPDPRFSPKIQYLTGRLGMLIGLYDKPRVLDIMPHNGDMVLQVLASCGDDIETLYSYELTAGSAVYMRERFKFLLPIHRVCFLTNSDPQVIRIPLPDHSVEVVSCYERLGHFEDAALLVREMYRVLRPGGRALVVISNRYYPHMYRYKRSFKKNYALGRNWDFGPEKKLTSKMAKRLFGDAGFQINSETGLQPLEIKGASVLADCCRRVGAHRLGDWLEDWGEQRYCTRSFTRYGSRMIAYELIKPEGEV